MYKFYTRKPGMPKGYIHKIWLIMRLTTVILIATLMQVSAAGFAQRVTLNQKKTSLEKIFREIHTQTGYDFLYNREIISKKQPINISVKDEPLETVLQKCLNGQSLDYSIEDKMVVIKEKLTVAKIKDFFAVPVNVHGRVTDSIGVPLIGANIHIKSSSVGTTTDSNGEFNLKSVEVGSVLEISYISYITQQIKVTNDNAANIYITLRLDVSKLQEVAVVSTGYQTIPKERATGSFVLVDSALFSRKVGTNIIDRLDGVTSGLIFNKNKAGNTPNISIRGRSTIFSNADPLIILDNFPYDGDISNINPQDVKSITILKDASAASIWGSRAGNGVIVITTNKGNFNQKPVVSFNTNLTIGDRPDLYYKPQLTNNQFINVEQFLFDKGAYDNTIGNGYGALSPAIEIMLANRNGNLSIQQKQAKLDSIAGHDSRSDLAKYYYRKSVSQQYQLNLNGGGQSNKYYISFGYDKNLANKVTTGQDRLTFNVNNTTSLFNNKVSLFTGIIFSSSNNTINGSDHEPLYPYERIADNNGVPLSITDGNLRLKFVDTVGRGRLLDWHYKPLNELQNQYNSNSTKITDYRINIGLNYNIISDLKFSVNYTYDKGLTEGVVSNSLESYNTRNLINMYSQIDPQTGIVSYPIPLGGVLSNSTDSYYSHYGRGQFNYEHTFNKKHQINAIAGFEIKDYESSFGSTTLYGYNPATATNLNANINPTQYFPYIYGFNSSRIPLGINNVGSIDRYRSYYFNGSYTFNNRYVASLSARKDESNLFGVKPNQKGVPLWSSGVAWNISNESFYKFKAIPYLKLRTTFGYNGNVNKSISAYLTAMATGQANFWNQSYINIQNPPNPSLEWEKVKNLNFGIDFGLKGNVVSGSIEYWIKDGINLIGSSPIAAQTGVAVFTGNSANTHAQGFDIVLNSQNLNGENFKWNTNFLFNYNTDKITSYKTQPTRNGDIVVLNYSQPLVGYSYYSVFSYKWNGLDKMGNPQGSLNGKVSEDYSSIINSNNVSDLVYSGTFMPKYYGSLRNTFSLKNIQFSFNLTYKLGYVYRRSSLNNSALYSLSSGAGVYQQPDFDLRWQKEGDELTTNVPSLIYPTSGARDAVYNGANILVEKADNVKLDDIKINYLLSSNRSKKVPFSNINIYIYVSNLGIIWKASKYKIDPDYAMGVPLPKMYSLGIKTDF